MPPHEDPGAASEPNTGSSSSPPNTPTSPNWAALKGYLTDNKIDSALWLTRVFTIINSILFLLPLFSPQFSYSCYKRALISSAATSALRLHQRLPRFQFSREYFGQLFVEDSCHYLMYCIMFINCHPVTLILIPVAMFAILHTVAFTKKLLDVRNIVTNIFFCFNMKTMIIFLSQILGTGGIVAMSIVRAARQSIEKVELYQQGIMRFIACTEIMLMPSVILMTFSGQAGIVIPFVYYRFLGLRYASRRNPYCRYMQLFTEFRRGIEGLASHSKCPAFARSIILKVTSFIANLAPSVVPAAS
ncbi:hypothetical protein QZH41_016606 [Actinostola sp. cb2023]|nr:hypothetical protein QZH41_016606 [Actinostola sp. cb2023]